MEHGIEFVEEEELGATPTEVLVEGREAKRHENPFTGGQRIEFILGSSGPVRHLGFEGEPFVIAHMKYIVVGIGEVEEPVASRCVPRGGQYLSQGLPRWPVLGSVLGDEFGEVNALSFDPLVRPDELIDLIAREHRADGVR